jgi:hypothetical protein
MGMAFFDPGAARSFGLSSGRKKQRLRHEPNRPAAMFRHRPSTATLKKKDRIDWTSAARRISRERSTTSEV